MYANSSGFGVLRQLQADPAAPVASLGASLHALSRDLAVSRASLWRLCDGGGLVCRAMWDGRRGVLTDGTLSPVVAGSYLAVMPQDRPVAAVDAPIDPVIGLLEEAYLAPFAVLSALHLRRGDQVIWLDQCRSMRMWTVADIDGLGRAADALFAQSSRSL